MYSWSQEPLPPLSVFKETSIFSTLEENESSKNVHPKNANGLIYKSIENHWPYKIELWRKRCLAKGVEIKVLGIVCVCVGGVMGVVRTHIIP